MCRGGGEGGNGDERKEEVVVVIVLKDDIQKVWGMRTSEQSLELKELQRGYRNNLDMQTRRIRMKL